MSADCKVTHLMSAWDPKQVAPPPWLLKTTSSQLGPYVVTVFPDQGLSKGVPTGGRVVACAAASAGPELDTG